jgi:glycosyltransferase involved in cell wall biosynthesis
MTADRIKNGLVSIGIPVYNGEEYLHDALASIQNQTYKNWECNIVNNCSTDRTKEIAEGFVKKDKRFKLHNYKEFYPIIQNWNRISLHIAPEAEYLKVIQADDLIDPGHLKEMIKVMVQYPTIGMVSSYRIDGKIVRCDGLDFLEGNFYKGKELLLRHLKDEVDITGSITTLLFRMKYIKKLPSYPKLFDEKDFHCDTLLAYNMMNISDVGFVFKILSYTRWHEKAYTSILCVKYNTFINGKENRLYTFKHIDPSLEKDYKWHRIRYAYFLIRDKLTGDKSSLQWHFKYLRRKFTIREYISAFLLLNIISRQFLKLFRKLRIVPPEKSNEPKYIQFLTIHILFSNRCSIIFCYCS